MEDQLISFETALLALEKNFDELCLDTYNIQTKKLIGRYKIDYEDIVDEESFKEEFEVKNSTLNLEYAIAVPTQSLLQKWLREKHNIYLISIPWKDHQADVNDKYKFRPMIVGRKTFKEYSTYEEALEKGLQEALKLI